MKTITKWNESDKDNLQDLATYAIMMLAYLKKGGEK